jgi:hypothetical protein
MATTAQVFFLDTRELGFEEVALELARRSLATVGLGKWQDSNTKEKYSYLRVLKTFEVTLSNAERVRLMGGVDLVLFGEGWGARYSLG